MNIIAADRNAMSAAVRAYDWAASPIGPIADWPTPLQANMATMLATAIPSFIVWGPALTLIYNEAYALVLATRHPGALGCSFCDVWPEIWSDLEPLVARAFAGEALTQENLPLRMERKGYAEETWFTYFYTPICLDDGAVGGFLCGCIETTGPVRADQALRAERDLLWETSPDLLLVIDFDGVFRRVNPAWTRLLGYAENELIGHHVNEFVLSDDHAGTVEAYTEAAGGGQPRIVNRYRHRDGSVRWISWAAAPAGAMTYATGRDITAEKEQALVLEETAEALRQSQKMEAVGQLTGGVAHDFNNLLTIIRSSVDFLRRPNLPEERRRRYMDAVSDTVDRAAKLTGQLLAFARRQALKPEVLDVGERLRAVADMIDTVSGARVRVVTELPDSRCFIKADRSQFETALINMAVNARDAMDGEGTLTLRLVCGSSMPAIRGHAGAPGPFVRVELGDTGSGIASAALAHIFEPFFTTKEVGKGTGLGLSQVFGFAKQSGGDVDVRSVVGEGSTFALYLPEVEDEADQYEGTDDSDLTLEGGGLRVLVVEDNVEVGRFATQILEDLGYATEWAANAEAALDRLGLAGGEFDAVFSDVVMPGMGGIALAKELRRRLPRMPVVLASGYSHVLAAEGTHGFELLHKPYSADQLSSVLRRLIGNRRRTGDAETSSRSS
jgi:PAS domain S-box-containing protein